MTLPLFPLCISSVIFFFATMDMKRSPRWCTNRRGTKVLVSSMLNTLPRLTAGQWTVLWIALNYKGAEWHVTTWAMSMSMGMRRHFVWFLRNEKCCLLFFLWVCLLLNCLICGWMWIPRNRNLFFCRQITALATKPCGLCRKIYCLSQPVSELFVSMQSVIGFHLIHKI